MRQQRNIFEAMWQILFRFLLQFISECKSERTIKTDLRLPEFSEKDSVGIFWLMMYISTLFVIALLILQLI